MSLGEKTLSEKQSFQRYLLLGAIIIIVATVNWLYPSVMINGVNKELEALTVKSQLTDTERQMQVELSYSRDWWESVKPTAFYPIATVLLLIGALLIAYGALAKFT